MTIRNTFLLELLTCYFSTLEVWMQCAILIDVIYLHTYLRVVVKMYAPLMWLVIVC